MRPVIDIRNVHRIFESEAGCAHILHNVSLAVNPGEFVDMRWSQWSTGSVTACSACTARSSRWLRGTLV